VNVIERARKLNEKFRFLNTLADEVAYGSGKLGGYAVTVKDCICTKDMESKAGSKILLGYKPPFDATVVTKIRSEGAFILGKTTQDEFGFGTFNVNTSYNIPLNPNWWQYILSGKLLRSRRDNTNLRAGKSLGSHRLC